MIYGYVRISTRQQSLDRQKDNIKSRYPTAYIVEEIYTGTSLHRPKGEALYKQLKAGDTVVFDEVSRMSRDAKEGFALYKELYLKNVNLAFLKEPHLDTSSYKAALNKASLATGVSINTGKASSDNLMMGMVALIRQFLLEKADEDIKLAFERSQQEVDYIHERTREGMAQARLHGRQIGREKGKLYETQKSKTSKEDIQKMAKAFGGQYSDKDCIRILKLSKNTYYKYKKELLDLQITGKLP